MHWLKSSSYTCRWWPSKSGVAGTYCFGVVCDCLVPGLWLFRWYIYDNREPYTLDWLFCNFYHIINCIMWTKLYMSKRRMSYIVDRMEPCCRKWSTVAFWILTVFWIWTNIFEYENFIINKLKDHANDINVCLKSKTKNYCPNLNSFYLTIQCQKSRYQISFSFCCTRSGYTIKVNN